MRGKGYGQQMIEYFIANEQNQLVNKGKITHVCLDVASTNPRAKLLYQRLGFKVKKISQGQLKNKYGRGVDHDYMEITLS